MSDDKINIHLQIAEIVKVRETHRIASLKHGPGQSEAQLRFQVANAILMTLQFCRDNEADIREFIRAKRAAHGGLKHPPVEGEKAA